jgi:hypothetical protein
MKYYGIKTDSDIFVVDSMTDSKGNSIKGNLVFKKKSQALVECEELNTIRQRMKLSKCYSVKEIKEEDICGDGLIIDKTWRQNLP